MSDNRGWRDRLLTSYSRVGTKLVAYAIEKCARCGCDVIGCQGKFEFDDNTDQEVRFARTGLSFRRCVPSTTEFDEATGETVCLSCYQTRLGAGGEEKAS
jgi:hypothetical protein